MELLFSHLTILLAALNDGEPLRMFGIKFFDEDFWELIVRFIWNLSICFVLVKYIYKARESNKDYSFTFVLFSALIFLVCYLLFQNNKLEFGFAFGLFAIFSILRYRTQQIPIKEMTYLFIVIAISIINALVTNKVSYTELLFTNFIILFISWILERMWYKQRISQTEIAYEKIENIRPENKAELLRELEERTGLKIQRYELIRADFLQDEARFRVFYFEED